MMMMMMIITKSNVRPGRGHEGPDKKWRYSSTLSLTSALNGGGCLRPHPGRFTPEKETRYPLHRRPGWPQAPSRRVRKISHPSGFFLLLYSVCTSSVLVSLSWLSCILPVCLYLRHNTNIHAPGGILFILFIRIVKWNEWINEWINMEFIFSGVFIGMASVHFQVTSL